MGSTLTSSHTITGTGAESDPSLCPAGYHTFLPNLLSLKLYLRDGRTNERTDKETRLCPSLRSFDSIRCFCRWASILWGEQTAMLRRNLRGEAIKIRYQPINTWNLSSWLSGKLLKLLPPDVPFQGWNAINSISGVCPFVRPSLRWSLTLTACLGQHQIVPFGDKDTRAWHEFRAIRILQRIRRITQNKSQQQLVSMQNNIHAFSATQPLIQHTVTENTVTLTVVTSGGKGGGGHLLKNTAAGERGGNRTQISEQTGSSMAPKFPSNERGRQKPATEWEIFRLLHTKYHPRKIAPIAGESFHRSGIPNGRVGKTSHKPETEENYPSFKHDRNERGH